MLKAQISTEYLIILGIAIAAILPAGYFFYSYSQTSSDQTVSGQIETIGTEMLVNAESVYGLSEGSVVSLDVKLPENIRDMYILNSNELIIQYEISAGVTEAVFFSDVVLSSNYTYPGRLEVATFPAVASTFTAPNPITQGKKTFRFESKTNYVKVTVQ